MILRNKHIVFLHKDFPLSGAEQVTMNVANYLCSRGYRVSILVANHHSDKYNPTFTCMFSVVELPKCNIKYSKTLASAICNFIQKEHVDVLITYREIFYAKWLKKQTNIKIVFELHNTPYYEFLDTADKRRENCWLNLFYGSGVERLLHTFYRYKYRHIYGWCDAYGLLCEGYRQMLVTELSLNPTSNKTWILPNSIKPQSHIVEPKEKVVLYVGRLSHRDKRVDRLLRIWKKASPEMSEWRLQIVGDGKAATHLKEMAEKMSLKNLSFEGRTNDVKRYYDQAAILCLTSTFEGWPMSIAEAQSNGVVPVLFNSFAGATDLVSTEDEGVLVPPFDEDLFARKLVSLANAPERLRQMSEKVVTKSKKYNLERSGLAWETMLQNLMKE